MKTKRWVIAEPNRDKIAHLSAACGLSSLASAVLCARGVSTAAEANAFLRDDPGVLHDPMLLPDMARAVELVQGALARCEKIAVFGDYDVDGITATCLMTRYLREQGADVLYYIPDRLREGYGLNKEAIEAIYAQGVRFIITVDSGISAFQEIDRAKELGMEVVITDHHECRENLPAAGAIVNPCRLDSTYPFDSLAGVGVAFKLICALAGEGKQTALLEKYADLVAMGTVADVMPLVGENRAIVTAGLRRMGQTENVGIRMLLELSGQSERRLTASVISYILAPRINAAGRMGRADLAVELFLTDDARQAHTLASTLCEQNKERQMTENKILEQALLQLRQEYNPLENPVIVLAGEDWHHGVIGIVSSRICDRYCCPTVLIAMDGDKGKGSARSIKGFHLYDALEYSGDLLEKFGGHELAAGLTVDRSNIGALKERLTEYANRFTNPEELTPILPIDCAIAPEHVTEQEIKGLSALEPFGMGNAQPVFAMEQMLVEEITPISSDRHVRLTLVKQGIPFTAMLFGTGAGGCGFAQKNYVDVAFHLEINEFRGRRTVQLVVKDIRLSECELVKDRRILRLYDFFMADRVLTQTQARVLLPDRADLVAVWRHIIARSENNRLTVPSNALSRRITWESRRTINIGKLFVCLDVFSESQLLSYHFREGQLHIIIKHIEGKADISRSVVLRTLQQMSE